MPWRCRPSGLQALALALLLAACGGGAATANPQASPVVEVVTPTAAPTATVAPAATPTVGAATPAPAPATATRAATPAPSPAAATTASPGRGPGRSPIAGSPGAATAGQRTLTGHESTVSLAVFSPDGKTLVSGGDDELIKLWDVASGKELKTLTGHTGRVLADAVRRTH